jgi:hypothetical protein
MKRTGWLALALLLGIALPVWATGIINHVSTCTQAADPGSAVDCPRWLDALKYSGGSNGQWVVVDTSDGTYRTAFTAATMVGATFTIPSDSALIALGVSSDAQLAREQADVFAFVRGTNNQNVRVYGTKTDASNYARHRIGAAATDFFLLTESAGTGVVNRLIVGTNSATDGPLELRTRSVDYVRLTTGGDLVAITDNTPSLGAAGATRWKSLYLASRAVHGRQVLTYGTTVNTDASTGNEFSVTATNGTAFTMANPTNLTTGQVLSYTIRNTSGGALGTVTWGTTFKLAAWTSPATANSRSIEFVYDGTNLVERSRTTADVPN